MNRKNFLRYISGGSIGIILAPSFAYASAQNKQLSTIGLKIKQRHTLDIPAGKRVPFGWSATGILPDQTILVKPQKQIPEENLWIRVSIAQEIWDEKLLHVSIPNQEIYLGAIDIRFSSVLVPYELEISKEYAQQINQYGLELKLESKSPIWIFNNHSTISNSVFSPHIIASSARNGNIDDFLHSFISLNSIQSLGWREGCVLDGLWQIYSQKGDTKALQVIENHFSLFFDKQQRLQYETSKSIPHDNQIDGIESTLPYATLARIDAQHPALKIVVDAWDEYTKPDGMIIDGKMISAEGCYTVAYPLAVIGKAWQRDDLKQKALTQLKHRFILINNGQINLRSTAGKYTFTNWARGAAWFLLGFARTISELKDDIRDEEIILMFQKAADIAISMQQNNGLWNCFMHQNESAPDTSGSAGITAALITGIQSGFLDKSYLENIEKCWNGLQNYLTPDGYLKGVAQDNRGGMALQEGNYRVIAQMGMGLMAQLYAAMNK